MRRSRSYRVLLGAKRGRRGDGAGRRRRRHAFVVPCQSGCGEMICFEESCTRETETGEERLPGKSRHGWEQDAMVGNLPMPRKAVGVRRSCKGEGAVGARRRGFWLGLWRSRGFRITKQDREPETGTDSVLKRVK
jgi:hypothetical protein